MSIYSKRPTPKRLHYAPSPRSRIPFQMPRRLVQKRSLLRVNWPQHCGVFVVVDHWAHFHGRPDQVQGSSFCEAVLSCGRCGYTGRRETFDPDPVLDWWLQLGRAA